MKSTKATVGVVMMRFIRVAKILFVLNGSVVAFLPDVSTVFERRQIRNFRVKARTTARITRWVSPSSRNQEKDISNRAETTINIEGLQPEEEFSRLAAIDETIRGLQLQLPTILTKALSPDMAERVYSEDNFCFSVLVDDEMDYGRNSIQNQGNTNDRENIVKRDNEIVILNSREELMALSDVLVLTTAAAQQAIIVTGTTDARVKIECQLIMDSSFRVIRIPWRAKAPALTLSGTGSGDRFNNFEGITDCYLGTIDNVGKVERFVVRKANFNGRTLNGPAIGQALKRIRSTLSNLQQNPILQNIVRTTQQGDNNNNNRATTLFNTLRDEFLDQATTALSTAQTISAKQEVEITTIPVYRVDSIDDLSLVKNNGWIQDQIAENEGKIQHGDKLYIPCPGTNEWKEYVDSRYCVVNFSNEIIPQLSDLSIIDSTLFAENATYKTEADESILMTGGKALANFFQSMALTRKGTGGTWSMTHCEVLDWKDRKVAISYEATTGNLPLWTIQGRDIYKLDTTTCGDDRPIITTIQQGQMVANGPNGNTLRFDGRWLTENVAAAFQGDENFPSSNGPRDFLTELLMNQPSLSPFLQPRSPVRTKSRARVKSKVSESTAAASFYIMQSLYEQGMALFDTSPSSRLSPPGFDQMSENIELKGYLGESIVRGSSLYNQSIGSVIFGIRESIRRKRLLIEEAPSPPRIELLVPTGEIRLSLTFLFRIPSPGVGIIVSPNSDSPTSSLPLKVELTSDYRIDPDTGLIVEHRLVETRVNGQLTAGDQVSRWMQRFLKLDGAAPTAGVRNEDGAFAAILDAISWFRPM